MFLFPCIRFVMCRQWRFNLVPLRCCVFWRFSSSSSFWPLPFLCLPFFVTFFKISVRFFFVSARIPLQWYFSTNHIKNTFFNEIDFSFYWIRVYSRYVATSIIDLLRDFLFNVTMLIGYIKICKIIALECFPVAKIEHTKHKNDTTLKRELKKKNKWIFSLSLKGTTTASFFFFFFCQFFFW